MGCVLLLMPSDRWVATTECALAGRRSMVAKATRGIAGRAVYGGPRNVGPIIILHLDVAAP